MYAPPADISVFDAVCEVLHTASGRYDGELSPYMRKPCDALASRRRKAVVFAGPGRCSKSAALIDGWTARNRVYAPGDQLLVHASQDLARYYSKIRLDRIIQASPELRSRLSPRKQDDNTFDKIWRAGDVLSIGWPSGAQLSARDFQYVAITEYDLADDDIDGEGTLYQLAAMRTQTYLSAGKVVVESSVRREYRDASWEPPPGFPHMAPPATGITALYNSGTRNWLYWRCPECHRPLQLHPDIHVMFCLPPLDQLTDDLAGVEPRTWAKKFSKVVCRNHGCGVPIEERWKRQLNKASVWVPDGCALDEDNEIQGEEIETDIDSYQLSCVAACYAAWPNILEKYAVAVQSYLRTGSEVDIKSTVNLDQGRVYLPLAARKRAKDSELKKRAEALPKHAVPPGARFLLAQVDVQAGKQPRFDVQIVGIGPGRERWIVDRFPIKTSRRPLEIVDGVQKYHPIDPALYSEDWHRIKDKVAARRYPLGDGSGRTMPVRFTICDSGGKAGVTARAYEFFRWLRSNPDNGDLFTRFRLYKGAERENAKTIEERYPDASDRADRFSGAIGDVPVLMVNVTTLKDTVLNDVLRSTPGPGFYHFPNWLPDSYYREFAAETRTARRWERVEGKPPNEAIDLGVMCEIAILRLGADRDEFWRDPPPWARSWDENPDVRAHDAPPPPPPEPPARRPAPYLMGHR
ncbi:terminase gpA endonuclease subunit [Tahibacter harae]|uniref:Phage terminase large subunit family protein n=1 Tax=Tahibacter harae TaxID=2963937 RepID=A0ABT1QS98_9GAMM|nr:terminase gpA endonuclease subunit [Tahibacter harae]MCQ4165132.1 phage terminase large subunit family protein [Tahibacter harae]